MLPNLPIFGSLMLNEVIDGFVKILFITGFVLYLIFAFIATRQISLMKKTVITPLSPFISLLGYAHLLLAIAALLFAISYL